jgi:hypothetical protein
MTHTSKTNPARLLQGRLQVVRRNIEAAKPLLTVHETPHLEALKKALWFAEAEIEAIRAFGYSGLVDDAEHRLEQAFANGESPTEAIRECGDHVDLTYVTETHFNVEDGLGRIN